MPSSLRDKLPGTSALAKQLRDRVHEVAESDAPILIEGERGTGREWVARVLHTLGPRKSARFVRIDPDESPSVETSREVDGDLARAHGGTLLVKEVAHVGRGPQKRLVRAIRRGPQRKEPTSDVHDVRLDVRVIAATCVDLERAVADELFDAELFDKLRAMRITLPPLRQRSEDVAALVDHFARVTARELGVDRPAFAPRAIDKLSGYSWPGNIAELQSVVRRLCMRGRRDVVEVSDVEAVLPPVIERVPAEQLSFEEMVRAKIHALLQRMEGYPLEDLYEEVISRVERPLIELVLERTSNNQVRAAEILGMNRNTLRKKISERNVKLDSRPDPRPGARSDDAVRIPPRDAAPQNRPQSASQKDK
ncbi:MAG: sigma 54-interacting transcriptional regulator [Polyangia bacterium]